MKDKLKGFSPPIRMIDVDETDLSYYDTEIIRKALDESMPKLMATGKKITIISTPMGKKGFFWDMMK